MESEDQTQARVRVCVSVCEVCTDAPKSQKQLSNYEQISAELPSHMRTCVSVLGACVNICTCRTAAAAADIQTVQRTRYV